MGFDPGRFTGAGSVDKELICCICMCIMDDPVQTPCEHYFCRECITEWMQTRRRCPVDRTRLHEDQLQPPSRLFSNMLGKLPITCEFRSRGCRESIQLENLDYHELHCPCNPDPAATEKRVAARRAEKRAQKEHQGGAAANVDYDDGEGELGLLQAAGAGLLVLVGGLVGLTVGGIMGYRRGKTDK